MFYTVTTILSILIWNWINIGPTLAYSDLDALKLCLFLVASPRKSSINLIILHSLRAHRSILYGYKKPFFGLTKLNRIVGCDICILDSRKYWKIRSICNDSYSESRLQWFDQQWWFTEARIPVYRQILRLHQKVWKRKQRRRL